MPGAPVLASAFTGTPHCAGDLPLTEFGRATTVTGQDAALAVLQEGVAEANALLYELGRYVAAQRRTAWVLRWSDRHNTDQTSAHATREAAVASLAAVARRSSDVPDGLTDSDAVDAWCKPGTSPDRDYDITDYEVEDSQPSPYETWSANPAAGTRTQTSFRPARNDVDDRRMRGCLDERSRTPEVQQAASPAAMNAGYSPVGRAAAMVG